VRVLVTGSRSLADREKVAAGLTEATATASMYKGGIVIIVGGAVGADTLCRLEAWSRGWHVATVKALWGSYGNSAGHIRNDAMVTALEPHACAAFIGECIKEECPVPRPHDSHGVSDCIRKARNAGIPLWEYR
jgi:hypothetical protein